LESVGNALGDFRCVDTETSDIFHSTVARVLVEVDTSKGLPEMISLDSPRGSWSQLLDYEGIPFRCRTCHSTGHIAVCCPTTKNTKRASSCGRVP
jgi:hypothetical protein